MADQAQAEAAKLYSPRLLALSSSLASYPFSEDFQHQAEVRSRTCGSELKLGVDLDANGAVSRIGMMVSACAVGQSSAAILAESARGRYAQDFVQALTSINAWLAGDGELPDWPGFDALEPALPHKGRHDALRLPWSAIVEALSTEALS